MKKILITGWSCFIGTTCKDFMSQKNIEEIKCYTTRPDTLFGMSFLALSIDHPIAEFYTTDPKCITFKKECSKTGTTEE